jgi:hypothetical protein
MQEKIYRDKKRAFLFRGYTFQYEIAWKKTRELLRIEHEIQVNQKQ